MRPETAELNVKVRLFSPASTATKRRWAAELLPDGAPRGRHRLRFAAGAPPLEGAWSGRIESPRVELRS